MDGSTRFDYGSIISALYRIHSNGGDDLVESPESSMPAVLRHLCRMWKANMAKTHSHRKRKEALELTICRVGVTGCLEQARTATILG
jgi:hypothetical protein